MNKALLIVTILLISLPLISANRLLIYHNNNGMVSERIDLDLNRSLNEFTYKDIPQTIDGTTVILNPLDQKDFVVRTQSHINDSVNFQDFIKKQIGNEIELVTNDGNLMSGELIFFDHNLLGLFDKVSGNQTFVRINEVRNFNFKPLEFDFVKTSHLAWSLHAERKGNIQANLSYLCTGLSWDGIYKAIWDGNTLTLDIMANISNNSGKDFADFLVSLIAGDPRRISPSPGFRDKMVNYGRGVVMAEDAAMSSAQAPSFETEVLDEYHIYTYSEEIDIRNQEQKQIRLYPQKSITPDVYYEYVTFSNFLSTTLKTKNSEDKGLGVVLPRGKIQIYRTDSQDLSFIGEDNFQQKPVNEEIIITPGKAFDLVGETVVKDSRRPARNVTERDLSVKLRNQSKETKRVEVKHTIRGNWTISRNSLDYEQIDATTIKFHIDLKPDVEFEITWTERVDY
jgi:hypothetical protein